MAALRTRISLVAGLGAALVLAAVVVIYDRRHSGVDEKPKPRPVAGQCERKPPSRLATQYLGKLQGVEIGASYQNSFYLPRAINVDFQDEVAEYWQDKGCPRAVVNIVAFGDALPFKDNSLDYVLSSHVIEHFFDPVKALREWHRVVRPGGYIFVIAPHMDRTFDRHREPTSVDELLARNSGRLRMRDYARPLSQKALEKYGKHKLGAPFEAMPHRVVLRNKGERLEEGWAFYEKDDFHHWSAWRTADFVALARRLALEVIEVQDVDDKVGNGFTVVIRK